MSTGARRRLTYANVMSTIAVFLALGGGAMAATHLVSSSGAISACANAHTGALRAIRAGSKCHRGEVALSWNQRGPAGATGAPGAQGSAGTTTAGSGAYSAGTGLSLAGNVFSVDTSKVQSRVYGECTVGTAMGAILPNGSVDCATAGFSKVTEKVVEGQGLVIAQCAAGETATGGGFYNPSHGAITSSYPYGDKGWQVETYPLTNTAQARVMCASR